jgi:prepilin-type N-terminal cleavage/methylation domain-containing protein
LFRKRLREETGYTLVEVLVAITILAVAILPMFGMFDMGLNAATQSSHYDKARTLANLKMEETKSMPFVDVIDDFPVDGNSTPDPDSGYYDSFVNEGGFISETGPASADFPNPPFQYRVEKQYMQQPQVSEEDPDPSGDFQPCDSTSIEPNVACDPDPGDPGTGLIRVTVEVRWGEDGDDLDVLPDKSFTTFGLVAE